ncbi:MAG TPA: hypothetical protein VG322_08120 [Candidatus Acidoferrales bacterium]|jgi:hypothetical protein|nr:hypothetical protein [Candidatus Acidoferrales bacterium]
MKKRAAQSRYFQKHRRQFYAKRAARMRRYEQEEFAGLTEDQRETLLWEGKIIGKVRGLSEAEILARRVRSLVRLRHDWHGGPYDGPLGRPVYIFRDGKPVLTIFRYGEFTIVRTRAAVA